MKYQIGDEHRQVLDSVSLQLRQEILHVVDKSRRGHIASAFSLVEIMRVLYTTILNVDPKNSKWSARDRFILSKGHGCLAQYIMLAERGFITREQLYNFCMFDSILGGHPDARKIPGVEASTGALAHGLSIGMGYALSARMDERAFRTFVIISDGECHEGSTWEAALSIAKYNLTNIITIMDYNKMHSYGQGSQILNIEPLTDKWNSFGFGVTEVNGHSVKDLEKAFRKALVRRDKPQIIIAHTVKGKGVHGVEDNPKWHHKAKISDEEMKLLVEGLEIRL